MAMAALLIACGTSAHGAPPAGLSGPEQAAWWLSQCTKLGVEASQIETLQENFQSLDRAADRLNAAATLPNGELMYNRLQTLERETRSAANEAARRRANEEHVALYAQYTRRMDQLVAQDTELKGKRGVHSFQTLIARHDDAEAKWKARQSRYPLAKGERDDACRESVRAATVPYGAAEYTEAACEKLRLRVQDQEKMCGDEAKRKTERLESSSAWLEKTDTDIKNVQKSRDQYNCNYNYEQADRVRCQESGKELKRLFALEDALKAERNRIWAETAPVCGQPPKRNTSFEEILGRCTEAAKQRTKPR